MASGDDAMAPTRPSSAATITLNARPFTVVGVLPASYRHLETNPERPAEIFALFNSTRRRPTAAATSFAASDG